MSTLMVDANVGEVAELWRCSGRGKLDRISVEAKLRRGSGDMTGDGLAGSTPRWPPRRGGQRSSHVSSRVPAAQNTTPQAPTEEP